MPKKERWPVFGKYVRIGDFKGRYFRLKTTRVFVDFPNLEIRYFLQDIYDVDARSESTEAFYASAKEIIDKHNASVEAYLNWILGMVKSKKAKTRYITFYMDNPDNGQYGVGYKISSYNNVKKFAVSLVNSEQPISVKYFYLFRTRRAPPKWLYSESGIRQFKKEITPALKNFKYDQNALFAEIGSVSKILNSLIQKLKKETIECEPFLAPAEVVLNVSSSLLPLIKELIKAGQITSVYIILRRIIEDVSIALKWRKLNNYRQEEIYHDLYYNEFLILKKKGLEEFKEFEPERKIKETDTSKIGNIILPDLKSLYDTYSFFVHVNLTALQVLSFSSIIEFGILKEQLKQFSETLKHAIKVAVKV